VADVLVLLAVVAVPLGIGALTAYLERPWWWGALVAVVLAVVALVAPEPEEGESRLVAGDIVFLLVVALLIAALTWLGAWGTRRLRRRPSTP
jgi:hypothetical protein